MSYSRLLAALLVALLGFRASGTEARADLQARPERVAEWEAARFGLFIHWGPWSQTGVGYIWKMMPGSSAEERARGFELWRTFNPVNFDPRKWARAAKDAGMKYVVFVTKHHDGFNNYDTQLSDYRITAPESPFSRHSQADLTRSVIEAFRAEGLAIGLYYSHIDWHHPDGRFFARGHPDFSPSHVDRDPAAWRRFADYQLGQLRELLTRYGKIDIVWFDIQWPYADNGPVEVTHPVVRADVLRMMQLIRTLQPDAIVNDRGTDLHGDFHTPEQRVPETGLPGAWEANLTITNERGYWYKGDDVSCKTPAELIRTLVEIASKGGNLLLNVGPRGDGALIAGEYRALAGIGDWMRRHGESIYGTSRSPFFDLPWGRVTVRDRRLFLHVFDWPEDGVLTLPGLQTPVVSAWRLTDPDRRRLRATSRAGEPTLLVGARPDDAGPHVIAVDLEREPVVKNVLRARSGSPLVLSAARAEFVGAAVRYNYGRSTRHGGFLENLTSTADRISWDFAVERPGTYRVALEYAVQTGREGSSFLVRVGDADPLQGRTQATATWQGSLLEVRTNTPGKGEANDNRWTFKSHDLGQVTLESVREQRLVVEPVSLAHGYLFFLKSVTLTPVNP